MYQINERLDTFSRKERDRIKDSEGATKLRTLISKYGKAKVAAATKEAESEKSGKKITYRELRHRIENAKGRLKKGEVKKWDKEKGRWVSNKEEDVNEEPNWNDGVNVRWNLTPNKKEISLNYNGTVIASKKKETYRGKTKPESAVDKGLLDFKNKGTEHLAQNFIKNNPLKTKKSVNEGASIALRVGSSIPWGKVITGIGAAGTLANTVFKSDWYQRAQERKKIRDAERKASAEKAQSRNKGTNTDTPARIKDGKNNPEYIKDYRQKQKDDGTMGKTKPGGQWDKLPSDKKKYKPKFNPKQNMTDKQIERMRKAGLL